MNVRSHYQFIQKGRRSSLITPDSLKQLQGIDFDFAPKNKSYTKYYIDHLDELRLFKVKHGHCRVPQKFPANRKLGGWVLYVRQPYRKHVHGLSNSMTLQRIEQLAELGFDFEPQKGRPSRLQDLE
jgi:Helicase associated domain